MSIPSSLVLIMEGNWPKGEPLVVADALQCGPKHHTSLVLSHRKVGEVGGETSNGQTGMPRADRKWGLTILHLRHLRSCRTYAMDLRWTAATSMCSISSMSYCVSHCTHDHDLKHNNRHFHSAISHRRVGGGGGGGATPCSARSTKMDT